MSTTDTSSSSKRSSSKRSSSKRSSSSKRPKLSVDREATTPFLLRVYVGLTRRDHWLPRDFHDPRRLPAETVNIYTWRDATLSEIHSLLSDVFPEVTDDAVELDFEIVYPTKYGDYNMRKLGRSCGAKRKHRNDHNRKPLDDLGFEIGDFLVVNLFGP